MRKRVIISNPSDGACVLVSWRQCFSKEIKDGEYGLVAKKMAKIEAKAKAVRKSDKWPN